MDSKTIVIGLVVGLLFGGGGIYAVTSQQQSSLQDEIASLEIEVDKLPDLEQIISTLTVEKISLQSQITPLEAEITSLEAEITPLEAEITSLEAEITSLEAEITSLQGEVAQVSTLEHTLNTLSDEKTALETTVTTLNTQLEELTATVSQLENASQEQETTIEDLQALNLELMDKIPTYPSGWTRVVTASGQGLDTWGSELFYVPNEQIRITWQSDSGANLVRLYINGASSWTHYWNAYDGKVVYVTSLTADRYYVIFDPLIDLFPPEARWTLTVDVWAP